MQILYQPRTDGQVKHFNHMLQDVLAKFVNQHRNDWVEHLPYIMMTYHSTVHSFMCCCLNMMILGREVSMPLEASTPALGVQNRDACPFQYVETLREFMLVMSMLAESLVMLVRGKNATTPLVVTQNTRLVTLFGTTTSPQWPRRLASHGQGCG